jgi:large subunit ribosomal protein L15
MPIYRRLPKRGFKNPFHKDFRIVNLHQLNDLDIDTVDVQVMEEKAIIRSQGQYKGMPVKILAEGAKDFNKKINVKANAFSETAKKIIEQNGGKAEVI